MEAEASVEAEAPASTSEFAYGNTAFAAAHTSTVLGLRRRLITHCHGRRSSLPSRPPGLQPPGLPAPGPPRLPASSPPGPQTMAHAEIRARQIGPTSGQFTLLGPAIQLSRGQIPAARTRSAAHREMR